MLLKDYLKKTELYSKLQLFVPFHEIMEEKTHSHGTKIIQIKGITFL